MQMQHVKCSPRSASSAEISKILDARAFFSDVTLADLALLNKGIHMGFCLRILIKSAIMMITFTNSMIP